MSEDITAVRRKKPRQGRRRPRGYLRANRHDALSMLLVAARKVATAEETFALDMSDVHRVPVGRGPLPHGWTHDLRHAAWAACAQAMRETAGRWIVRATVQAGTGKVRVLFFRDGPGVVP